MSEPRQSPPGKAPRGPARRHSANLVRPRARPDAAAQRAHSRNVSLMRVLVPGCAVALVAVVVVWAQWQTIEERFKIGWAGINPEEAKTLRMVNPRFAGTNKENRPYTLTAAEARRVTPDADSILLTKPVGDMTTAGGSWVSLSAANGNYAQSEKILDLGGGVDLFHDKGMHFNSPTARINLDTGIAEGRDPVTGNGPSIELAGEGFKILNDGKTVIFTGKAKAILYPRDKRKRRAAPERRSR